MEVSVVNPQAEKAYRCRRLAVVFSLFDLDDSGQISKEELHALGEERRKLGHKSSRWTAMQTEDMMANMKMDTEDDLCSESEFVQYFDKSLPKPRSEFASIMEQFTHVAERLRVAKEAAETVQTVTPSGYVEDKVDASRQASRGCRGCRFWPFGGGNAV